MKEHFKKHLPEQDAIRIALLALANAAEEDVGTGGPDPLRRIYPTMKLINEQGVLDVPESDIATLWQQLLNERFKEA